MDKLLFISILEFLCLFIWAILYYLMFNSIKVGYLSILVFLLPIISTYIHHYTIKQKIKNEDTEYFTEVIDKETKIMEFIGVIIFGLSLILTNFKNQFRIVERILFLIIIFGLLVPLFTSSLIHTKDNLYHLIIQDVIIFSSESVTFALFVSFFGRLFLMK